MTLKEARFHEGLNQWDLSVKTQIPQSKISIIENGYVIPTAEERKKLAAALGKSESDLFFGEDEK